MKPLFSIIIPVYNKERYIAETLTSVLRQTLEDFEVVLVDDGSTDSSLEVAKSFQDPRIKIYTKSNGGVSETRNFGIKKAQSEYIALLDADDKWEPEFLKEMAALINKYPLCGLYASAYKKISSKATAVYGGEVPEGIVEDFFKVKLLHIIPCSSAVVIRKSAFEDIGGFPVGMVGGEDDYTWAKIALKYKVAVTPKVLSVFNEIGSALAFRLGKLDSCEESWFDFYEKGKFYRNEFIARKAIYAGIRYAYGTNKDKSTEIEKLTRYNVLSRKLWWDLYFLNRIPYNGIMLLQVLMPHYRKAKSWVSALRRTTVKPLL